MGRSVKAMPGKILAIMIDKPGVERKTAGGLIINETDGTESAIRPRWFKIYSVGKDIDWIKPEQYVLVDHGRWSRGMEIDKDLTLHLLDNKDCLMESETDPREDDNTYIVGKTIPQRSSGDTTRGI